MDNRSQLRIALEAEAMLGFLTLCEAGKLAIVSSEVLICGVNKNPIPHKRAFVPAILDLAESTIFLDDAIEQRAKVLESRGFKAFDALHIASAESTAVDYFCTCDDRALRKARLQTDLSVKIVSLLELANEVST